MLKYKRILQIKYTEAILSNSARKLLWFEITKMLIAVLKNKLIMSFIIIFGTLSFRIKRFVSLTYRSQKNVRDVPPIFRFLGSNDSKSNTNTRFLD